MKTTTRQRTVDTLASAGPRRRERSLKTIEALVGAARDMLLHKSVQELSINDLCASIGMTTGAFYNAFDGKDAFFKALQRQACDERMEEFEALLSAISNERLTLAQICERMVRQVVLHARRDAGLLRASLLHKRGDDDSWEPFRELGNRYKDALARHLAPHLSGLPPRTRNLRVRFANQTLHALVVQTVLNDPGPLGFEHDAFIDETTRMMVCYLESPA
jgi:AcrR family transcriptional regulator